MELFVITIFIFCAAMAAGSILLVLHLMEEYQMPFMRSLFYYLIFILAFGFYGVWGQFLITMVAGNQLTTELLSSISVISLLLGLPFLVFAWLMLLQFAAESSGIRLRRFFAAIFLAVNFGAIIAIGIAVSNIAYEEALPLIKYYYSAASMLFTIVAAIMFLKREKGCMEMKDRVALSLTVLAGSAAQTVVLLFIPQAIWMALVFVFLLFASNSLLVIYLSYKADLKPLQSVGQTAVFQAIGDLYKKYEISPREAEIIQEICNGLSNQEIADKLFISLQTVKDHTSRIYSKTNVKSRMQLLTLIRASGSL